MNDLLVALETERQALMIWWEETCIEYGIK